MIYKKQIFKCRWEKDRNSCIEQYINQIIYYVDTIKKLIRNNVKVICFSKDYSSMLMWSHYANYHQGFLLIYDKDDLKIAKRYNSNGDLLNDEILLRKVEYVKKQLDLTDDLENFIRYNVLENLDDIEYRDASLSQEKLQKAITQKSLDWKYEKEWRLISKNIDLFNQSELSYIECIPKGIILGAHCSNENSERIIKIANEINIPVYRMFLNEFVSSFKLNVGNGIDAKVI